MRQHLVKTALGILALSSLACGTSILQGPQQTREAAQATEVAAQIYGTQTANAPTVTPTATATNTATPTTTSTPTITPTATATPLPDASQVVLREGDAPNDFESISRQAVESQEEALEEEGIFPFGSYSGLVRENEQGEPEESLIAYVVYLNTADARSDFNDALQDPEGIVRSIAAGRRATVNVVNEIEGLDDLGDSSNGVSSTATEQDGTRYSVDIIVFRRGIIGVFLYDFFILESEVDLVDVASILDERAVEITQD